MFSRKMFKNQRHTTTVHTEHSGCVCVREFRRANLENTNDAVQLGRSRGQNWHAHKHADTGDEPRQSVVRLEQCLFYSTGYAYLVGPLPRVTLLIYFFVNKNSKQSEF